jgi:hypothetical protein
MDKGRLELNYTTFNALQDGRAFKTYYHNTDHHLFNAFCEKNNFEHGFSSVLDKDEKNSLIRVPTNIPEEKEQKSNNYKMKFRKNYCSRNKQQRRVDRAFKIKKHSH